MEFSKNSVFHRKGVEIIFQNDQIEIPTLSLPITLQRFSMCKFEHCNFTPIYAITVENISKSSKSTSTKKSYLRKFWASKPISLFTSIKSTQHDFNSTLQNTLFKSILVRYSLLIMG